MHTYQPPEILISVLRSTSFLLEHYGYSGHDPSLSELQRSLGRAVVQLEIQAQGDSAVPNAFDESLSGIPANKKP
jgi:hypothetical protein